MSTVNTSRSSFTVLRENCTHLRLSAAVVALKREDINVGGHKAQRRRSSRNDETAAAY